MLRLLVVAIVTAGALSAAPRGAEAGGPGYPWCAHYPTGLNECNFYTWQQCRAAISGNGGLCSPNLRFRGELPPQRRYVRWYWW